MSPCVVASKELIIIGVKGQRLGHGSGFIDPTIGGQGKVAIWVKFDRLGMGIGFG